MSLHSVVFLKDKGWNSNKAREWLKKHDYKPIKRVHKTENTLRYRLRPPKFKRYITKKIKNGINLVIGF